MAYFYGATAVANWVNGNRCLTKEQINQNFGENSVRLNSDGTVSVYYNNSSLGLYPVQITLECCKVLDPTYYFDIDTQTCRWAQPHDTCGFSEPINLIVNPKGNDGTLFFVDDFEKETCDLKISFDYLLKIKCEDLLNIVNPTITTNIQSQETTNEIVKLQMEIGTTNVSIEEITNQVFLLNNEYEKTPYSIECNQFPVTTTGPCVRPLNLPVVTFWSNLNIGNTVSNDFTSTNATACNAALHAGETNASFNGQDNNVTKLAIGGTVYNNIRTTCDLSRDGYFITNLDKREVTHVINGIIESVSICPTTTTTSATVTAAGLAPKPAITPFDNTAFGSPTEVTLTEATLDNRLEYFRTLYGNNNPYQIYRAGWVSGIEMESFDYWSPTSYTSVNFCLTDAGLAVWETILGPINYQLFIAGDVNNPGYTCADVITLTNQPNPDDLFYECTIPFGTKSEIWTKITQLMVELSELNTTLTNQQNELITLQNTFVTTTTSNKSCNTMIDALESLDVEMHLDIVNDDNTLTSVFSAATFQAINSTTNLYDYLVKNPNSGFYICGDPSKDNVGLSDCTVLTLDNNTPNVDSCNSIIDDLVDGLMIESGSNINDISKSAFTSNWLTYTKVINDPTIIALITNKKIKISFKVKFSCVDFCLLLDNLVLDKSCKSVDRKDIIISQNPGFELKRVIDNKKSWIDTTSPTNREFLISKSNGTNPIRQTDYDVNDERLVINSKEIDLDISVASAIETDVWCYLNDNPCLLSGCTNNILTISDPFDDTGEIYTLPTEESYGYEFCGLVLPDLYQYPLNLIDGQLEKFKCGKILKIVNETNFHLFRSFYLFTEEWDGNLGFYIMTRQYGEEDLFPVIVGTDVVNESYLFETSECCESLNSILTIYNSGATDDNQFSVYWDSNCQKCKVLNSNCGESKIDFNALVTQPISGVTTIEQFENLMVTELIDVKNRQTISSYPTLRAVYDRYLHSSEYCGTVSSAFDYQNMDRFAGLIGNYWIDLIEQVVPSTTIWGSVKIYTNTIFDEQKFKYKSYSTLLCKNPFNGQKVLSPINGVSGQSQVVNVVYEDLLSQVKIKTNNSFTTNLVGERVAMLSESDKPTTASFDLEDYATTKPITNTCDNLSIAQMNSGSEFISYIDIPAEPGCSSDLYRAQSNIKECTLNVNVKSTDIGFPNRILEVITVGGTTPFTYSWSNGETTKTIAIDINIEIDISVTVTDANCCTATYDYWYRRH